MRLADIAWHSPPLVARIVVIVGSLLAALIWPPGAAVALLIALFFLISLAGATQWNTRYIDERIVAVLPGARRWHVHSKTFPAYKFVDITRAARWLAAQAPRCIGVDSEHRETLAMLLSQPNRIPMRRLSPPTMVARQVGPDEELFLPTDAYWLFRGPASADIGPCVVRVRLSQPPIHVTVEVAAPDTAGAERVLDVLLEHAAANSVYLNQMLRVTFGRETRALFGKEETVAPMDLAFLRETPVTDEAIVLDETIKGTLERAVVDFHRRRDELMRLGVPGKRGVLFYGPPGTGKTYTCRYLSSRLAPVTTIVATGYALMRMKDICALAAMLQPALVLLEDVDLVFASRELNPYNTVLGEFMDELDGFGAQHHVTFVLTTNAIERVEAAIKDRPGRISQCILFGPPGAALRRRYLERMLRAYPQASCRLEPIVAQTEGVSQAFLKELVFRGVQIATAERPVETPEQVVIGDAHIDAALGELLAGTGQAGRRIIGFRVEADGAAPLVDSAAGPPRDESGR